MIKKTLLVKPDITSLLVGNDSRFAYCVADSLFTYDIVENGIIQRLPKTRYSQIALSGDGTLLAAIRPVGLNTEVIFYHIENQLYEERRVLISTEISSILPCFSVDNLFLFVCSYDTCIPAQL